MLGGLLRAHGFASAAAREQERAIDDKLRAMRAARKLAARTAVKHARELEDDLGRVALLARALAEVCLQKGLLTRAELGQMILDVDMADGSLDGKLDPEVAMPGERKLADLPAMPPKTVRRKLRPR